MKRIISLILAITLVLLLSGCTEGEHYERDAVGEYEECYNYHIRDNIFSKFESVVSCDGEELTEEEYSALYRYENIYYTQKEVDEMLQELYDFYIEENEQDIAELKLRIEELENLGE